MKNTEAESLMVVRERERERELFFRKISFFKHAKIRIGYIAEVQETMKRIKLLHNSLSFL